VFKLIFGALVGAAVMWLYGDQIRQSLDETTRTARAKAADALNAASEGLQATKETLESGFAGTRRTGSTG
jgi:hypothetical protein